MTVPTVIWQGTANNNQTVRVFDRGAGASPRIGVEYLAGTAALGEPIWSLYTQYDPNLISEVALALGVIQ